MATSELVLGARGGLLETVLWTNNDTTVAFPASSTSQDVTLSDSITNYKYIKFVFCVATTDQRTVDMIYNTDELTVKFNPSWSRMYFRGCVCEMDSDTSIRGFRQFFYVDNTTIKFIQTVRILSDSTTDVANVWLIPKQIIGLN